MLIHHSFKDANRPANNANPQSLSINDNGDVLFAHRIPINNTFSKSTGLIRRVVFLYGKHDESENYLDTQ